MLCAGWGWKTQKLSRCLQQLSDNHTKTRHCSHKQTFPTTSPHATNTCCIPEMKLRSSRNFREVFLQPEYSGLLKLQKLLRK